MASGWSTLAWGASPLASREALARYGLERAWFAQVPLDARRSRVSRWEFYADRLYAVSTSGLLTSVDAQTGETLWTSRVGKEGYEAFGPGGNQKFVAAVSGARLYVFDRHDGRLLWTRELGSAPSTGAALTERRAFVALANGQIEAYRLDDPQAQPWYYQSKGRTFERPTATGSIVSWPTESGLLYVSSANDPRILFRLETSDEIVASPAAWAPYLYVASLDGYLYSIHELNGSERWRFSVGYAIVSTPAVYEDTAYVASTAPKLHAIDAAKGNELWSVPGVEHFAARGRETVYAQATDGSLVIIDKSTGAVRGSVRLGEGVRAVVNDQTDRIFLTSDDGLVQCVHESDVVQPVVYRKPPTSRVERKTPAADEGTSDAETPFAETPAASPALDADESDPDPFFGDDAAAESPANDAPAGRGDEEPPADGDATDGDATDGNPADADADSPAEESPLF